MAVINHNWFTANAGRKYPLDDAATITPDAGGALLPSDIIVDLSLRFPVALGGCAFVGAVTVSPALATVVILAAATPEATDGFRPVAALTVVKPVRPGQSYGLLPLADGVAGWLVFGDGVETAYSGRFVTPRQGLLAAKAARPYHPRPVTGFGKALVHAPLEGIVRLLGAGDVEVVGAQRVIDNVERTVAVVRLKQSPNRNVFDIYRGPCSGRPESGTCLRRAIEAINTVKPDCNGNIILTIQGAVQVGAVPEGGGLVLDYPLGMAEACTARNRLPDSQGKLPNEYDDLCTSLYEGYDPDAGQSVGGDVIGDEFEELSSFGGVCAELPYLEDFSDCAAERFSVVSGSFAINVEDEAASSEAFVAGSLGSSMSGYLSARSVCLYKADSAPSRNVAVWDACAYGSSLGKEVMADVRLACAPGASRGGLALNWHRLGASLREEYLTGVLDRGLGKLRLLFWTGSNFSLLGEAGPLSIACDVWYRLRARITAASASHTRIQLAVFQVDPLVELAEIDATTTRYLPDDGLFGFGANQSVADFTNFRVAEYP